MFLLQYSCLKTKTAYKILSEEKLKLKAAGSEWGGGQKLF